MGIFLCSICVYKDKPVPMPNLSSAEENEDSDEDYSTLWPHERPGGHNIWKAPQRPYRVRNKKRASKAARRNFTITNCGSPTYPQSPSLIRKIHERNSYPETPASYFHGKLDNEVKLYISALEDNSMTHINDANHIAQSMVEKGDAISTELVRQREVTKSANRKMLETEHEINQTGRVLKGMSLHGKLANMMWGTRSSQKELDSFDDDGNRNKLKRSMTLPANFSYQISPADTKQERIKGGVKQLIRTMDVLGEQQRGISDELESQEPHLRMMHENMGRVQNKMKRQTTQINELQE